jgi:hypothetical protein
VGEESKRASACVRATRSLGVGRCNLIVPTYLELRVHVLGSTVFKISDANASVMPVGLETAQPHTKFVYMYHLQYGRKWHEAAYAVETRKGGFPYDLVGPRFWRLFYCWSIGRGLYARETPVSSRLQVC